MPASIDECGALGMLAAWAVTHEHESEPARLSAPLGWYGAHAIVNQRGRRTTPTATLQLVAIRVRSVHGNGSTRGPYRPFAPELVSEFLHRSMLGGGESADAVHVRGHPGLWLVWTQPSRTVDVLEAPPLNLGSATRIPDHVPQPPEDLGRDRGTAWRLGWTFADLGLAEEACPYAPERGASKYRGAFLAGHRTRTEAGA